MSVDNNNMNMIDSPLSFNNNAHSCDNSFDVFIKVENKTKQRCKRKRQMIISSRLHSDLVSALLEELLLNKKYTYNYSDPHLQEVQQIFSLDQTESKKC
jgi:hypothetical protein